MNSIPYLILYIIQYVYIGTHLVPVVPIYAYFFKPLYVLRCCGFWIDVSIKNIYPRRTSKYKRYVFTYVQYIYSYKYTEKYIRCMCILYDILQGKAVRIFANYNNI